MRGAMIKCPNCGAAVNDPGNVVRCSFCGTQVRVQRRTGFFERAEPPPAAPVSAQPLMIAVQGHSTRWTTLFIIIPVVVALGAVAAMVAVKAKLPGGGGFGASGPTWDGVSSPLVVDVDGDGSQDIVGRLTENSKSQMSLHIGAFRGTNGKPIWQSERVGDRSVNSLLAVTGKTILVETDKGRLFALELETGKKRWSVQLTEHVDRVCIDGGSDSPLLILDDKTGLRLDLASGKTAAETVTESGCQEVAPNDGRRREPPDGNRDLEFEEIDIDAVVTTPAGTAIAYGSKPSGTPTPMIARVDGSGKKANLAWTAAVPSISPLEVSEHGADFQKIAIDNDVIAVAYEVKGDDHPLRLSGFALETGSRKWDVVVPGRWPFGGIAMSDSSVFVVRWKKLVAFDRVTGSIQFTIE